MELYIHIPFCVRKCEYCDFLSAPAPSGVQKAYLETLVREIQGFFPTGQRISSVFFGGGTPSLLPSAEIGRVMEALHRKFVILPDAEISIECNPGTAELEKLRDYHSFGINRLSLGLQSADNRELRLLGRIHTWEQFQRTFDAARTAGFSNINVDLMSALPGQTVRSWRRTLEQVLALSPEHISAYSLIVEEGTPFCEKYAEDAKKRAAGEEPELLPSEEEERHMYYMTQELLALDGMRRYEISNYAREGYECRHNTGYWRGIPYAGFGLGAASLLELSGGGGMARYRNPERMEEYLAGDFKNRECIRLTVKDQMEEFMFLGLRLTDGVSAAEFNKKFGVPIETVYGSVLERQIGQKLLERKADRIRLTGLGMDVCNTVMEKFLLD